MTSSLVLATVLSTVAANTGIDKNFLLSEHNIVRCMHGAGPLKWDKTIASHAQSWANTIKYPGYHGGMDFNGKHYGQNLAGSCSSGTAPQEDHKCMTQWMSEEAAKGGHYTQVVWKGSKKLGCGMWCGRYSGMNCCEVACDYYPAGNMRGAYDQNVQVQVKSRRQCESEVLVSNQDDMEDDMDDMVNDTVSLPAESEVASAELNAVTPSNDTLTAGCTKPGSIPGGSCQKCLESAQCSSGFCCPYMKKCVTSSSQGCYYPIGNCQPTCHKASCTSCHPTDGSQYPSGWAARTCRASDNVLV